MSTRCMESVGRAKGGGRYSHTATIQWEEYHRKNDNALREYAGRRLFLKNMQERGVCEDQEQGTKAERKNNTKEK